MDWKDINKEELSDVSTDELKSIRIQSYSIILHNISEIGDIRKESLGLEKDN